MVLAVAACAFAGAVCRYLLDIAVQHRTHSPLPLGTLAVNVTGSVALGFVVGLGPYDGLATTPRTLIGTGFLGAYTTFSTFSYETVRLVEDGAHREALVNTATSLGLGLAGAAVGLALAGLF
jgi:fluoride exporter